MSFFLQSTHTFFLCIIYLFLGTVRHFFCLIWAIELTVLSAVRIYLALFLGTFKTQRSIYHFFVRLGSFRNLCAFFILARILSPFRGFGAEIYWNQYQNHRVRLFTLVRISMINANDRSKKQKNCPARILLSRFGPCFPHFAPISFASIALFYYFVCVQLALNNFFALHFNALNEKFKKRNKTHFFSRCCWHSSCEACERWLLSVHSRHLLFRIECHSCW